MALDICLDAFVRAFLVMVKIAINNWFFVLLLLMIFYMLKESSVGQGIMATLIDVLNDTMLGLGLLSGGILGFAGKLFMGSALAVALGVVWMMVALTSPANLLLKIFALPVFFVLGVIAAVLPFFSIPMSFVLAFLFKDPKMANFTCIIAIVIIVMSGILGIDFVCNGFNWVAFQLQ